MSDDLSGETFMSPTVATLFAALSKVQAVIRGAKKDAINPHLKNKYADLASVWDACRDQLVEHGFCVVQTTRQAGPGGVCVVTTLGHSSGEWIRGEMYMPAQKLDAQGFGSALTYARRYGLSAIVGVSPEDDDGNDASLPKQRGGPIKAPATATNVEAQLRESVEIGDLAKKIKAAIAKEPTAVSLKLTWDAFCEVDKRGWPKKLVDEIIAAKNARLDQLRGQAAE